MIQQCPECGARVLTATMTSEEEARFAAAFRCLGCGRRFLEAWAAKHDAPRVVFVAHEAIDEK